MIKESKCYFVECDNCNEIFENFQDHSIWMDKNVCENAISDSCVWVKEGDKHYCRNCKEEFLQEN